MDPRLNNRMGAFQKRCKNYFRLRSKKFHGKGVFMSARHTIFAKIEQRAVAAQVTIAELCQAAEISRPTYWRASTGKQSRADSFIPTLRKLEAALDRIESERAA